MASTLSARARAALVLGTTALLVPGVAGPASAMAGIGGSGTRGSSGGSQMSGRSRFRHSAGSTGRKDATTSFRAGSVSDGFFAVRR